MKMWTTRDLQAGPPEKPRGDCGHCGAEALSRRSVQFSCKCVSVKYSTLTQYKDMRSQTSPAHHSEPLSGACWGTVTL